jgi:hypothetical protein
MEFLSRFKIYIALLLSLLYLAGCAGGGELATAASSLVEIQREADLTRTALSGSWKGNMFSVDGVSRQTFSLVFVESSNFSLDESMLIGENILLGGGASIDTFNLLNGVFDQSLIRFNIARKKSGEMILSEGEPILFNGVLTENSFMSGELKAGPQIIGFWEAYLPETATAQ